MAADQMAAEPGRGRQRLFQIDFHAGRRRAEDGEFQRLAGGVGPEPIAGEFDGGQADAADGDAVSQLHVAQVQLAGGDAQPDIAAARLEGGERTDSGDDAGEHGFWSMVGLGLKVRRRGQSVAR